MLVLAALLGALLVASLAWAAVSARADGDPASDVLATQSTFIPRDGGLSSPAQRHLEAVVAAAGTSGFPIRVALIARPSDLGSVSALWQQPAAYARYLGEELSLLYRGAILVVMPAGVGFQARAGAGTGVLLEGPRTGDARLARIAGRVVERLAAAAGHPLDVGAQSAPATHRSPADPAPWIAFIVGLWLVCLCWWASLRARPPRWPSRVND